MRIDRIEAFRLRLPLVHAFETSSHRKSSLEHILLRTEDSDGAVGWGEVASPSGPYYSAETTDTCWLLLERYLMPALAGVDWEHPSAAGAAWKHVRGHHFAKAGLDIACWDLWARRHGQALPTALGGTREQVPAGVSLGIEKTTGALLEQVRGHVREGYLRVKLKIGPGWDVEPVAAVREEFGDLALQVDANGAYTEDPDHLAALTRLDGLGLLLIEQPFAPSELLASARLQRRLATPVCLDESVDDAGQLATAVSLEAGSVLNVKVSRMGGLTPARAAVEQATAAGWRAWCGGMHEFGVGRAANIALASLDGCSLPSDVSGSDKYFRHDVVSPPIRASAGFVPVPTRRVGLGHEIEEDMVRRHASATLHHAATDPTR